MPYFKRRPYAEMVREAEAAASRADPPGPATGALALANAVLSEELTASRTHSGDIAPCRLEVRAPVAPGETGRMTVGFENDDPHDPVTISLRAGDLVGRAGARIPADRVDLAPRMLTLPPGGAHDVRIAISVPPGAAPGAYTGPLVVDGVDGLRGEIAIEVRPRYG